MVNDWQLQLQTRKDRRNEVLGSRVTQPERRLVEAAAAAFDTSISEFIRAAIVAAARETVGARVPTEQ